MHFAAEPSLTHSLNHNVLLTVKTYLNISKGSGRQSGWMTRDGALVLLRHLQFPPVQKKAEPDLQIQITELGSAHHELKCHYSFDSEY